MYLKIAVLSMILFTNVVDAGNRNRSMMSITIDEPFSRRKLQRREKREDVKNQEHATRVKRPVQVMECNCLVKLFRKLCCQSRRRA